MARKKKDAETSKVSDTYLLIQFRAGRLLQGKLAHLSREWKLSTNESARRICLLMLAGLRPRHYAQVMELAEVLGDPDDFASATQAFAIAEIMKRPSADDCDLVPRDDSESMELQEMIDKVRKKRRH